MTAVAESQLSADEQAAIRAFLQRCEVRLSTIHRVASALLSGAGVMVLLPPVAKDSIVTVITALTEGSVGAVRGLLIVAAALSLTLPLVAFWLLIRDLTRFYFHAQHLKAAGDQLFLPRFTLTGLRLPTDELDRTTTSALDVARRDPATVELLVPANPAGRAKTDRRLAGYGFDTIDSDVARANAMFALAAAHERTLVEEVAKIEHGMARHLLRLQVIVLRYVKALIAFMATALAVFAMSAVEGRNDVIGPVDEAWLAAILALWAAGVAVAVAAPVRWVEQMLRAEGATRSGVANDSDLTRVERISTWIGAAVWVFAVAAMYADLGRGDVGAGHAAAVSLCAAVSGAALAWHVFRFRSERGAV
jgi:hypothetical protein